MTISTLDRFLPLFVIGLICLASLFVVVVTLGLAVDIVKSWLSPSTTKSCFCNSCSDKFAYGINDTGVSTSMRESGWLVLPSNVHYCPMCANMVRECCFPMVPLVLKAPADFDASKLDNLGPRQIVSVPINPYEVTVNR